MAHEEILALDLSTSIMYVAWAQVYAGTISAYECNASSHTIQQNDKIISAHSAYFVQEVESVRARMHGAYERLRTMVVNMGPGSFTGLRMALSFARGIQAARNCRIVGVSAIEQYVSVIPVTSAPLLVLLHAQRNTYFCQVYAAREGVYEVDIATPEICDFSVDEVIHIIEDVYARFSVIQVCGNGAELFLGHLETHRPDLVPMLTHVSTHDIDLGLALLTRGYEYDVKNMNILQEDTVPLFVRSYV